MARVVIRADAMWQLTRNHGETRRRTQGRVAVGTVKDDTVLCHRHQVRHLDDRLWVVHGQYGGGHLIRHDEEDIGRLHARPCVLGSVVRLHHGTCERDDPGMEGGGGKMPV